MKKQIGTIAALLILVLVCSAAAQIPEWYIKLKKIEPRVSSKSDVEQLFEDARINKSFIDRGEEVVFYDTAAGRLTVVYAAGTCPDEQKQFCNYNAGTVLEAVFFPRINVSFSKFKLKKKELDFFEEDDNPTQHYVDTKAGLDHAVQRKKLMHVQVFHPSMYEQVKRLAQTGDP